MTCTYDARNGLTANWQSPAGTIARTPIASFICPSDGTTGAVNSKRSNYGKSNYLANAGNSAARDSLGVMFINSKIGLRDIEDGTTKTVLMAERSTRAESGTIGSCGGTPCNWGGGIWIGGRLTACVAWYPAVITPDIESYGGLSSTLVNGGTATWAAGWGNSSDHPGGLLAAFCDGSVSFFSNNIEPETYRRLRRRNDQLPVGAP